MEESLADGPVSDPSEVELEGDGDQEYDDGDEVIHPVPASQEDEERPARRRAARAIARPVRMTNAELEVHRVQGHVIYHPGCEHCVRARALADRHMREDHGNEEDDPNEPPVIGADFCFPGDGNGEEPLTVIVMTDSRTKSMFANSSPGKEVVTGDHSEYLVTKVTDNINSLGHGKVVFKTDKEKALVALQSRVQRLRDKATVPLNAPRGESQANGATENAVQRFEGIFRSMRLCLESQMGTRIPLQHPLIHWMVEAAAELHNRWRPVKKTGAYRWTW